MKLPIPWPWRRRPPAAPELASAESEPASPAPPIDLSVRRELVYRRFGRQPGACPRCGGPMRQRYQVYAVSTRHGNKTADSFIAGSDMGWFCTRCPVLVINPERVAALLEHQLPHWNVGRAFALLGIVDLDAIPEEKRHLELGADDNPLPLVPFAKTAGVSGQPQRQPKAIPATPSRRRVKRKKPRRR